MRQCLGPPYIPRRRGWVNLNGQMPLLGIHKIARSNFGQRDETTLAPKHEALRGDLQGRRSHDFAWSKIERPKAGPGAASAAQGGGAGKRRIKKAPETRGKRPGLNASRDVPGTPRSGRRSGGRRLAQPPTASIDQAAPHEFPLSLFLKEFSQILWGI